MGTFWALQFNSQFGQRWDAADPDRAPIDLEATIAEIQGASPGSDFLQEVEQACTGGRQIEPPPTIAASGRR